MKKALVFTVIVLQLFSMSLVIECDSSYELSGDKDIPRVLRANSFENIENANYYNV